jgi:hypothetical protein
MTNETLRYMAAQLGRKGGKAGKGKAKARTSEQARAAVNTRWKKYRKEQRSKTK